MENGVVIADKTFHKGMLYGSISSGGAMMELSNGKYIRFTALNDKFVNIQIVEAGIGKQLSTQRWQKTKVIKEKVIVEKEVKPKDVQEHIKFDVGEKDEILF